MGINTTSPNSTLDIDGTLTVTGSGIISGSFIANDLTYPTVDGTDGQAIITDGAGVLSFGNPGFADEAEKVTFAVQNGEAFTLAKGTPVHITSTTNGTSIVIAASASDANTMPAHGILNQQLTAGSDGFATILGQITGVDTSAFNSGDTVYVGPFGGYTNVKPTGSTNLIQNLGVVKKVDAGNGTGEIFGTGRSNDVPNLPVGKIWVGSSTYSVTSSTVHLDEGNDRLGLNTTSPIATLDINGDAQISGSNLSYQENLNADIPRANIASVPEASASAVFFDYVCQSGSNARAGTIMSVINESNIEFAEQTTNDIGDTTDVTLSVVLDSGNIVLQATLASNDWYVQTLVRTLKYNS